ncbi:MAG: hydroxymethylbilane synthase, partial [Flavobacteriia bacterium]|nr:hydroxymethylbilane synthase [Flavobacteriia bacterium]
MDNPHIRIGTRGSDLALWQAKHVKRQLENLGCTVEITIIQTQGDRIQDLSFDKL